MTSKDIAAREAELEAREAELAKAESNVERLANPGGHGSTVLDGGIQLGKLRCKDQLCRRHWDYKPVNPRVEELIRFIDIGQVGSPAFSNAVQSSHVFYYPDESILCDECERECVVIPPGGGSAFDNDLDERIAEATPGQTGASSSRIERLLKLRQQEKLVREIQDGG